MPSASPSNTYEHGGEQGHKSRLERLCDMPPGTRCATIDVTYRVSDFSDEGGKTMCSVHHAYRRAASVNLQWYLSTVERCARRRTTSLSAFMQSSAVQAADSLWHLPSEQRLDMLKGIEACPDVGRKIRRRCPMAGVIRGCVPVCVAM